MAFSAGRASASGRSVCWRRHRQIAFGCRVRRGPRWRRGVSRGCAFHDSMGLFVDGAGPPAARPPSPSRMSATAIRRSRLPAPKVPAPTFNPATRQSAQDVTAYPGHTFWPITRFTVPHCLRWQADTRYLRFEGLISRSRNIYLRFKGLPKRDIRSMRGHPALESCGFRPGSTRAPTPRNADRCPNEDVVGKAIRESEVPREDIIVASKLPGRHHQYDQARVTIEESVARMGLDYIDLYLIHWPNPLHRSHAGRQPSRAVPLLPVGRAARLRSGAWHHHRGVEPIGPRQPDA